MGNVDLTRRLDSARSSPNPSSAIENITLSFRASNDSKESANVFDYNAILHALVVSRAKGQPITYILETYNVLTQQIAPNTRTYRTLILTL